MSISTNVICMAKQNQNKQLTPSLIEDTLVSTEKRKRPSEKIKLDQRHNENARPKKSNLTNTTYFLLLVIVMNRQLLTRISCSRYCFGGLCWVVPGCGLVAAYLRATTALAISKQI
jgi:hypothetical protein